MNRVGSSPNREGVVYLFGCGAGEDAVRSRRCWQCRRAREEEQTFNAMAPTLLKATSCAELAAA